jgi:hypothetical protein
LKIKKNKENKENKEKPRFLIVTKPSREAILGVGSYGKKSEVCQPANKSNQSIK